MLRMTCLMILPCAAVACQPHPFATGAAPVVSEAVALLSSIIHQTHQFWVSVYPALRAAGNARPVAVSIASCF